MSAEIISNIHEALLQHTAGIPINNKVYTDASELILTLEATLATLRKAYRLLPRQKKKTTRLITESKKDISKFNTTASLESIPPALYYYEDNYYIHLFDGIIIKLNTLSYGYSKEICIYQRRNVCPNKLDCHKLHVGEKIYTNLRIPSTFLEIKQALAQSTHILLQSCLWFKNNGYNNNILTLDYL